jgi:hypothetical protein
VAEKPDFDKLVQNVVNAAHQEGKQEQLGAYPMKPFYDATHKAVDALLDAIHAGVGVPRHETFCTPTEPRK